MDYTWWSGDGAAARVGPDFSGATVTTTNSNDLWDYVRIEGCGLFFQRPYGYGSDNTPENDGYFYLRNTDDDSITPAGDCWFDTPQRLSYNAASYFRIGMNVLPAMLTAGEDDDAIVSLFMTTSPEGDISNWTFDLMHYQPWAWYGSIPEVVASIIMQLGIDQDYIDADSFDLAHEYYYDLGGNDLLVSREWGQPIVELIKEVVRHGYDVFGFTMDGRITLPSRYSTFTGAVSGVIGTIEWRYAEEHLCNRVLWSYGAYTGLDFRSFHFDFYPPTEWNTAGDKVEDNPDYTYGTKWNPNLASVRKGTSGDTSTHEYEVELSDSSSITKHGERPLGGLRIVSDGPLTRTLDATHHRFQIDKTEPSEWVTVRFTPNATLRREVTIRQDFRGLDYDIGHRVSLSLGGDTAAYFLCISKSIDFDNLTVTSVLLEE